MTLFIKKTIWTFFFVIVGATGVALGLKTAVGVGAWDAFSQSSSNVTNIKVGTFSMMMNLSCILLQLVILKKHFRPVAFLQIGMALLLGMIVNLVYYDVLSSVVFSSYGVRLMLYIASILLIVFAISMIMSIDFLSFPLEAACLVVAQKSRFSFAQLRLFVDFACIVGAISLSFLFETPFTVREGTIIGMILFAPLLAYLIPKATLWVKRFGF